MVQDWLADTNAKALKSFRRSLSGGGTCCRLCAAGNSWRCHPCCASPGCREPGTLLNRERSSYNTHFTSAIDFAAHQKDPRDNRLIVADDSFIPLSTLASINSHTRRLQGNYERLLRAPKSWRSLNVAIVRCMLRVSLTWLFSRIHPDQRPPRCHPILKMTV